MNKERQPQPKPIGMCITPGCTNMVKPTMTHRRYKPTRAECIKLLTDNGHTKLSGLPIAQLRARFYRVADGVMGGL